MFWEMLEKPSDSLKLLTGTLANDEVVPVKFIKQIFLGDTVDGGASVWLKHPSSDGSACERFMLSADDGVASAAFPDENFAGAGYEQKTEDLVPVRCKCKGIDYILRRGDYSGLDGGELPWNVDPATHKYLTILCGCDSCRLQGGIDLWYWVYVETKHLSARQHNTPFPKSSYELKSLIDKGDPLAGSLSYYASSTNVLRFFCGTCSATVFYAEEKRPEILDLSVGLLEASDGARAEGFLSWWYGEIENKENADGGWRAEQYRRIENESEQWRIKDGYPKNWKRIANEQEKAQDAK
ncbi:hypothetical protein N0V94_006720 [Neodidymelliopsis sp. IMI 364377]|nr:hypothetical protein N0V94_006720 [Neodidymelliopsis sp. IMI 364377]